MTWPGASSRAAWSPSEERPEGRDRAKYRYPDVMGHIRANRPALVAAALTILRAYVAAGRPAQRMTSMGSFDEWEGVVRSAVLWTLGVDPCATREALQATDENFDSVASVIEAWAELRGAHTGVSAAEAAGEVREESFRYPKLSELFQSWGKDGRQAGPRVIGNRLKAVRGGVVNNRQLQSHERPEDKVQLWFIKTVIPSESTGRTGHPSRGPSLVLPVQASLDFPGSAGSAGSEVHPNAEIWSDSCRTNLRETGGN